MEKVHFELEVDEEGYPPVNCEQIDCERVEGDVFVVKYMPFYSKEVALGDLIFTELIQHERLFKKVKSHSDNSTIRIVFYENKPHQISAILNELSEKGLVHEKFSEQFYALNLPKGIDIVKILRYLESLENEDILSYEAMKLVIWCHHLVCRITFYKNWD
ncbi:DUF4265 domain-containing protein [Vitreoscilla massiliensis]|uniref:DUF4265 domain-containing protein n=1 Tax=Vitreoscilla massiliensis TaxID=1689272 RepID=A0ABY4E096_9NEIS|nr:DUF4265 domain-containing protein [Vitreoscilla massiliensis]UOO89216.1 DUF4265 domain-containing protein [Vitreoscilla massiliensis]